MKNILAKKSIKKLLFTILCLITVFLFCGCTAKENGDRTNIDIASLPKEIVSPIEQNTIYLLAELKEEHIYLYGLEDQYHVLLIRDGQQTILEWDYLTPRLILPEMKYADYDGDGTKELAVSLYNGSGTGFSVEELHIVSWEGTKVMDHVYKDEDYIKQLEEQTSWTYNPNNGKGIFHCGNSNYYVNEDPDSIFPEVLGLAWGDQVDFELTDEGTIKAKFTIGLCRPDWATPEYHGFLLADVLYDGSKFVMDTDSMVYEEPILFLD